MNSEWKNIVISPTSSVRDALKVINQHINQKIAIVADEDMQLLGVVTDGDIRRALLANVSLDDCVASVMNKNPITVPRSYNNQQIKLLMEQKGIFVIPVVDSKTVVGVVTYQLSKEKKFYDNPVFIMAGGFGTRLRPLTDSCPKPMLKVGGRPLLETLIINFTRAGFKNFYISTHYMPEVIMDYFGDGSALGVKIRYVREDIPLGTGGALGLLPDDLPALPLILINGDVLTDIDFQRLLDFHVDNMADATMCVREYEYQIPYGVITSDGQRIVSMEEKPTLSYFINAGIYMINPSIIKQVSPNQRIDMPSLLELEIKRDGKILMFPVHEYWLDIGRMDDYERAQRDFLSLGFKNDKQ